MLRGGQSGPAGLGLAACCPISIDSKAMPCLLPANRMVCSSRWRHLPIQRASKQSQLMTPTGLSFSASFKMLVQFMLQHCAAVGHPPHSKPQTLRAYEAGVRPVFASSLEAWEAMRRARFLARDSDLRSLCSLRRVVRILWYSAASFFFCRTTGPCEQEQVSDAGSAPLPDVEKLTNDVCTATLERAKQPPSLPSGCAVSSGHWPCACAAASGG